MKTSNERKDNGRRVSAVAPESLKSQEVIYQFATMFAGSDQILRVKWNNFNKVLMFNFEKHRLQEKFTDVTLLAEGKFIKAHRLVLSSTSKYFENIFDKSPESPLIVLDQVAYKDALSLVDYAYRGETEVEAKDLERFMSVGRKLGMKGMAPDDGEDETNLEPPTPKRGQESASKSENGGNTTSDKDGSSSKEQDSGMSEEESLPSSPKEDNNSKLPVFVKAEPVTPVGIPKKRKADDAASSSKRKIKKPLKLRQSLPGTVQKVEPATSIAPKVSCSFCQKEYAKYSVKSHEKVCTINPDREPYKCTFCDKELSRIDKLAKHIQNFHQ